MHDADGRREHWDTPDVDLVDLVLVSQPHHMRLGRVETYSELELVHAPTSATHTARSSTASADDLVQVGSVEHAE